MRIVMDTNVFLSGVFFRGAPRRIVDAIRSGKVAAAVSDEVLQEYWSVLYRVVSRRKMP